MPSNSSLTNAVGGTEEVEGGAASAVFDFRSKSTAAISGSGLASTVAGEVAGGAASAAVPFRSKSIAAITAFTSTATAELDSSVGAAVVPFAPSAVTAGAFS